jgi:cytosine/uracil/thiamine/allantoin permease
MSTKLPINIADLLRQRTVEGERIEYKAGWNPDAVIRMVCAFVCNGMASGASPPSSGKPIANLGRLYQEVGVKSAGIGFRLALLPV